MAKLFIPVGIPGCGKTTLAGRVLNHVNMRIIASDYIREELVTAGKLTSVNDMSRNDEVFASFHHRIEDYLFNGWDVFADATNLQPFARETLRAIADHVSAETHVIFFTNVSVAVSRNQKRNRVVPAEAMVKLLAQYEKALCDVPQEQYSTVVYIESLS